MKNKKYKPFIFTLLLIFIVLLVSAFNNKLEAQSKNSRSGPDTYLKAWSKKYDNPRRFNVLMKFNNEAVLDRETQLVWQREPMDQPNTSFFQTKFSSAVQHCYSVTTGGRKGWRLPTAEELTSLLVETETQAGIASAALPPGHPFVGITSDRYWSISEGSFESTPGRYVVAPNEPRISTVGIETNLNAIHPTWCVRGYGGGQSTSIP